MTLIQGVPKGEKLELILQKGTELGVNHFILVPMQRSVGALKKDRQDKKYQRWTKIIQEAARQCRQYHVPQLSLCSAFGEALALGDATLKLLLWEESVAPLDQILPSAPLSSVTVVVGPEGGVTAEEARLAAARGYQAASLGPRILRTETAGLAIMSLLQYRYGDLSAGPSADLGSGKG